MPIFKVSARIQLEWLDYIEVEADDIEDAGDMALFELTRVPTLQLAISCLDYEVIADVEHIGECI